MASADDVELPDHGLLLSVPDLVLTTKRTWSAVLKDASVNVGAGAAIY